MKKLLSIALVIVTVFSLMIPVFASAGVVYGQEMWVNCADGKTLNLRKEPSTVTGKLITRLECGTKVTVLDDLGNGWLKVTTGKNAGYVMAKFLLLANSNMNALMPLPAGYGLMGSAFIPAVQKIR